MTVQSLRFNVEEIKERQGLSVSLSVPARELVPEPLPDAELAGPVEARVELSVGGASILMNADLSGSWRVPCSRCLARHDVAFRAQAEETYPSAQESIDLSEDLRQSLLLEIPQRSLCRPGCRGLCSRCGKNLNEGPCGCREERPNPFDVLKKLK